jgi:hypothetical protein
MKHSATTVLHFVNASICIEGDSNGSKSSYVSVLHCHTFVHCYDPAKDVVMQVNGSIM